MIRVRFGLGIPRATVGVLGFCTLSASLLAQVGPPPVIVTHPTNQTVQLGSTVSFSVQAASITELRYKWSCDGRVIGANGVGTTAATLTLTNVQLANAGVYSVEVRNASGRVTSSNAVLTVLSPPVTCSLPQMTSAGFSFRLSGPPDTTFVVLASTNSVDWFPVSTNNAPAGSVDVLDPDALNHGLRYYRAEAR
jgi:hypothetical protein